MTYLHVYSQDNGEEGVDEVVDEVELDGFDGGGAGETAGHTHVDRGQGQQAGDVHVDHHLVPVSGTLTVTAKTIITLKQNNIPDSHDDTY